MDSRKGSVYKAGSVVLSMERVNIMLVYWSQSGRPESRYTKVNSVPSNEF
jgi:hypothetical protein